MSRLTKRQVVQLCEWQRAAGRAVPQWAIGLVASVREDVAALELLHAKTAPATLIGEASRIATRVAHHRNAAARAKKSDDRHTARIAKIDDAFAREREAEHIRFFIFDSLIDSLVIAHRCLTLAARRRLTQDDLRDARMAWPERPSDCRAVSVDERRDAIFRGANMLRSAAAQLADHVREPFDHIATRRRGGSATAALDLIAEAIGAPIPAVARELENAFGETHHERESAEKALKERLYTERQQRTKLRPLARKSPTSRR